MTGLPRPCLRCGHPVRGASYHPQCQPPKPPKAPTAARGYGGSWAALSREARRRQPWCTDCGTQEDLTTDHLRWPVWNLRDVDVVCRSCNSKRGARRDRVFPTDEAMTPSRARDAITDLGGVA